MVLCLGFGVYTLRFSVQGYFGFEVEGLGFRAKGSRLRM